MSLYWPTATIAGIRLTRKLSGGKAADHRRSWTTVEDDPKRPNAATIPQFSDDQLWLGNAACFGEAHHRHAESAPVTIKRDRQPVTD